MNLSVTSTGRCTVEAMPIEMVERKGLGHPDTICDNVAEQLSRALSAYYLERSGRILHHNVDKALLVGGQAKPRFGGGEIIEPIRLILAGRATTVVRTEDGDHHVPVGYLAIKAARAWLRQNIPDLPDEGVVIDYQIRPGSDDLREVVEKSRSHVPEANDTSLGVGHAPLSRTERIALEVEKAVREIEPIGPDVKVMALRYNLSLIHI